MLESRTFIGSLAGIAAACHDIMASPENKVIFSELGNSINYIINELIDNQHQYSKASNDYIHKLAPCVLDSILCVTMNAESRDVSKYSRDISEAWEEHADLTISALNQTPYEILRDIFRGLIKAVEADQMMGAVLFEVLSIKVNEFVLALQISEGLKDKIQTEPSEEQDEKPYTVRRIGNA